jgi:hypothetical protein
LLARLRQQPRTPAYFLRMASSAPSSVTSLIIERIVVPLILRSRSSFETLPPRDAR